VAVSFQPQASVAEAVRLSNPLLKDLPSKVKSLRAADENNKGYATSTIEFVCFVIS
jgi:hypothetical protein